jgi:hypothetical protein
MNLVSLYKYISPSGTSQVHSMQIQPDFNLKVPLKVILHKEYKRVT